MKKFLSLLLAMLMVLSLMTACSTNKVDPTEPQDPTQSDEDGEKHFVENPVKFGFIATLGNSAGTVLEYSNPAREFHYFDSLNTLMMNLQSEKINTSWNIPLVVSKYICAHNDNFAYQEIPATLKYQMGVLKENQEVLDILNNAIVAIKEDGTLDTLTKKYIDEAIDADEIVSDVEIPTFENAKTIKVAVTGDLPPLDYVSADGVPTGFNVALLAEIAKRANVNIEMVTMNADARLLALTTNSVDALFWVQYLHIDEPVDIDDNSDVIDTVALTESYFETRTSQLNFVK